MADPTYSHKLTSDSRGRQALERDRLALDLQDRVAKLNDQARIFIPLIALCLIFAIPIWSKSLTRFLILLLSPFVLLPVGFCIIHLALAWRGILKARTRIRDWERDQHQESGKLE
jgi:hypothetical protein